MKTIKSLKILFLSLIIILLLAIISVYLLFKIYNINFAQKETVFNIGLDFDFVSIEDINKYYENNIGKIDVINYDLDINLNLDNESISAAAIIDFIPLSSSNNFISLDFSSDFENISVTYNEKELIFKKLDDQLNIELPSNHKDTVQLKITYQGKPDNKGLGSFYITEERGSKRLLTLNEPIFASSWFPCNDFPDDKSQLRIAITNDSNYTSLSNGVLKEVLLNDDKKTYVWETYYPISTYLVAIYSAEYKHIKDSLILSDDKVLPVDYFLLNEDTEKSIYDLQVSKDALLFFNEKFGEYPFLKEKYGIAEFDWQMGAIENQTIVGIGSKLVSGNRFFSDVIVHEAAHHWWGNAAGLKSWKDIWLNEGFASYSEALYWENKSGRNSLISTLFSKKNDFNDTRLYDPEGIMFSSTIYNKGAWVLHMLRFEIGEDNFDLLLKEYFTTYKYSNASTDDLKNLAEKISGKNLTKFFDQWIYNGVGFIYADYSLVKEKNKSYLKLNQIQDGYDIYNFPLEVNLVGTDKKESVKYYITSKDTIIQLQTDFQINEVEIDPNNWLLANFIYED